MKQKITIEVDMPEGYEATGEYRKPRNGDDYLTTNGEQSRALRDWYEDGGSRIILRKVHKMPEVTHFMSIHTGTWEENDECENWRTDEIKKRINRVEFEGVMYDMFLMEYKGVATNVCLGHYNDGPKEK